jgi:hypothetical protein
MVNEIVEKNYRVRKMVEAIRKKAASSGALGADTANLDATSEASNLTANADDSDSELCIFTTTLPEEAL